MVRVLDRQNIFDVLLQESGGINNTARILRDNGLNFNDSLVSGASLSVDSLESEKIRDNYILKSFRPNNDELVIEPPVIVWILDGGVWNDAGVWVDSEFWQDN